MKNAIVSAIVLLAASFVMFPASGQSSSSMEGTYTNNGGMVTLDLESGGKAIFTMMGESMPCTYKAKDDKVLLDCPPQGRDGGFHYPWRRIDLRARFHREYEKVQILCFNDEPAPPIAHEITESTPYSSTRC